MAERSDRNEAGRLFDQHGQGLYRYALMLLADAAAAEDAIQQVFAALLKPGGPALQEELHYLRRAVRNECYSMLRKRQVRGDGGDRPLLEAIDPAVTSPDDRLALERALRDLPAEQRDVIHLHVYEGLTFKEIADACGESMNTIAARYRYALAKMKKSLTA
jgi:RNA polymerase sigma-70 factor (ECF subfamily)